jgi:ferric-dicitrate binding protein FerR (iron transport regulator)
MEGWAMRTGDEITAYLSETLEPEEKAAFEAQRALFDQVNKALAFKRKRSIDEQVARFEREVAAERAGAEAPAPARRYRRRWAVGATVALAASAAAVFVVLVRPGGGVGTDTMAHQTGEDAGAKEQVVAAPHRPAAEADGGMDGGAMGGR